MTLRASANPVPRSAAPVVEQIKAEHRALARVIGAMQALVARWRSPDETPDPGLFEAMLHYIESVPDRVHHPKEDRVLFPAIARRSRQGNDLIAQLEREHARCAAMLEGVRTALRRLSTKQKNSLEGLATTVEEFADFYWWHLHREEDQLLPIAYAALSDADWQEIAAAFASNTDPLFNDPRAAEYQSLYDHIMELVPLKS